MIPAGIISADGHVCEPANCYVDHIDPEYRDRAPYITTLEDGTDAFVGAGLDGNDVSPEQVDWLVRDLLGVSLQAALACNRTMLETDFTAELADVELPVLLVHGTADASIPLEISSARTVELLADARLEVYEHGPHGLFLTHRARLGEDLLAFAKG